MKKILVFFLVYVMAVSSFSFIVYGVDNSNGGIFAAYVNSAAPAIESVISTTVNETVTVNKVCFYSRQIDSTHQNIVYAIVAYPNTPGTYPGLMVLHGGSQTATSVSARVSRAAAAGYIAIAPDLPGIASPTAATNSSGPWRDEETHDAGDYLADSENPEDSSLYDAIITALECFHLLQSGNAVMNTAGNRLAGVSVDAGNIGITGISSGGYTATMVAGILTTQLKAVFSNYGSGFYDTSSYWKSKLETLSSGVKQYWLDNFDAGRRAQYITANYFVAGATNDSYFHPPAVMATLNAISSPINQVFSPNTDHKILIPGGTGTTTGDPNGCAMEDYYFDYLLKGIGAPLAKVEKTAMIETDEGYTVEFKVTAAQGYAPQTATLYYSEDIPSWTPRQWIALDNSALTATQTGYIAKLPLSVINKNISFYLLVSDSRPTSSSSIIYSASAIEGNVEVVDSLTPETIKVQAESPDTYKDSTPGKASSWMLDGYGDMDVSGSASTGAVIVSFAYSTTAANPEEWLRYKVTVPESATYKMSINVGTTKNCSVDVWVNNTGFEVFESYRKLVPATGSYTTMKDAFVGYLSLQAGVNYIKIVNNNAPLYKYEAMSFDYFTLEKVIYTGNEGEIIVDGADYNAGGREVGYHDTTIGTTNPYNNGDDVEMALENTSERIITFIGTEWLKYDVIVKNPTRYKLYVSGGTNANNGKVSVALNDGTTTQYAFPNTGGFTNRPYTYICDLDLVKGRNTIQLTNSGSIEIRYKGLKLVTPDPYSINNIISDSNNLTADSIVSGVTITKMNAYTSDAKLCVTVYNELNKLCYIIMQAIPESDVGTPIEVSFIPITIDTSKGNSFTAKAFVWSTDGNINPLSKAMLK